MLPTVARVRSDDRGPLVLALGCLAGFVVYTLSAPLLGLSVFGGTDLLYRFPPWSYAQPGEAVVQNGWVRDTIDSILPAYHQFHTRLYDGDFASWSPFTGGGTPLAAVPTNAFFSPLGLPNWLLPMPLALGWSKLLEIAVAAGGCYLLLRRWNVSASAGVLGGLIYCATGFLVAWTNWSHVRVAAFIPLLLWAVERFIQIRTARSAVPISLTVAAMIFGGFPQVTALGLYLAGSYFVVRVLGQRDRLPDMIRASGVALAAVALGVALTAVQLLPFLSTLAQTDLSYRDGDGFDKAAPLRLLFSSVFPNSFAGGANPLYAGSDTNPIEGNAHVGSIAVVLAAVAVLRPAPARLPRGVRGVLVGTTLVCLLLAYLQGPWVDWMRVLPFLADSNIGRVRSLLGVCVALLAAIGFHAIAVGSPGREVPAWRRRLEAGLLLAGLAGLTVAGATVWQRVEPVYGGGITTDVAVAVGCAGLVVLGVIASTRSGRARTATTYLVPPLVALQCLLAVAYYWPVTSPETAYPQTAAHRYLQDRLGNERIALAGTVMMPGTTAVYGLRIVGGHAFFPDPWKDLLQAIEPNGFIRQTYATLDQRDPTSASAPGLDRLAARYYVTPAEAPVPGTESSYGLPSATSTAAAYSVRMDPSALRAVGVLVARPSTVEPGTTVRVTVSDAAGELLGEGERRLSGAVTAGPLPVPVPGLEGGSDSGPWLVQVSVTGSELPLAVTATGVPVLSLVGPSEDGLRLAWAGEGVVIWERTAALPRIRWASATEVITQPGPRVDRVALRPLPADTVILSRPGPPAGDRPAGIDVVEDSGDTIRLGVDAAGPGYVVVADSIQDGWSATVGGVPADIVEADHALGAVHVDEGRHAVVLRYSPSGRTGGTVLSIAAAGILAVVAGWHRIPGPPSAAWRRRTPEDDPVPSQHSEVNPPL